MSDVVAQAKAALEGVTEGPWEPCHAGNIHYGVSHGDYGFPTVVKAYAQRDGFGSGSRQADAEFIAAARSLVPELLDEIERLQAIRRLDPEISERQLKHGIRSWSSNFMTDPPEMTIPIGGTSYTIGPDDAAFLHHILAEFLADCRTALSAEGREESTTIPLPEQLCTKPGAVGTTDQEKP